MTERKQRADAQCGPRSLSRRHLSSRLHLVSRPGRFLFCPVAKAASTFWGRFVLTLNTSGAMRSPFAVRLPRTGFLPKTVLPEVGDVAARVAFLRDSVKAVFVRDPYHRMFSAFVDKAFDPNPYY